MWTKRNTHILCPFCKEFMLFHQFQQTLMFANINDYAKDWCKKRYYMNLSEPQDLNIKWLRLVCACVGLSMSPNLIRFCMGIMYPANSCHFFRNNNSTCSIYMKILIYINVYLCVKMLWVFFKGIWRIYFKRNWYRSYLKSFHCNTFEIHFIFLLSSKIKKNSKFIISYSSIQSKYNINEGQLN